MREVITICALLLSINALSQKEKYNGGELSVNMKNIGKNVTLEYDSYFNSYLISYTNINGQRISERYDGSKVRKWMYNPKLDKYPNMTYTFIMDNYPYYWIANLKKQKK